MGDWADDILDRAGDPAEMPLDDTFVNRPGGPTLEELDANRAAAGEKTPQMQPTVRREDQMFPGEEPWPVALGRVAPGVMDTINGLAVGGLTGVGLSKPDLPEVRESEARSPKLFGAGQFAGEAGMQTALGAGPMLGGFLSGVGNTEGDLGDKLKGGTIGGITGKLGAAALGKLQSLLGRKAAKYADMQATHGLMHSGAGVEDLANIDATRGRVPFYKDTKRLGIRGKPYEASVAADRVATEQQAAREAIEARLGGGYRINPQTGQAMFGGGARVNPQVAANAVHYANPYPGVGAFDRATDRAARQVKNAAPNFRGVDVQRKYFGNATNFASGTPNANLGKRVHGVINTELEGALNKAEAGAGSKWRNAGRDENVGITMRDIAKKEADRRIKDPIRFRDAASLGAYRGINANRHAVSEAGYGIAAPIAGLGEATLGALNKSRLPQVAAGHLAANVPAPTREASLDILRGDPNAPSPLRLPLGGGAAPQMTQPQLGQKVMELLQGPTLGAELGAYKDKLLEAAKGSAKDVEAAITRLIMTDPQFRTTVLPQLTGKGAR